MKNVRDASKGLARNRPRKGVPSYTKVKLGCVGTLM
jgi:hypothetical protein